MGTARWNPTDWSAYAASTAGKSTDAVFAARGIDQDLNPFGVALRESRDSDLNPASTAIIVGLDVTGSMGTVSYTHLPWQTLSPSRKLGLSSKAFL